MASLLAGEGERTVGAVAVAGSALAFALALDFGCLRFGDKGTYSASKSTSDPARVREDECSELDVLEAQSKLPPSDKGGSSGSA